MKLIDMDIKMKKKKITNMQIAADTGYNVKAVSEWRNGKKFPKDSALMYLIGTFGELNVVLDDGTEQKIVTLR